MLRNNDRLESQVAVIGFAGRFPGAENTGRYWVNLTEKKDSVTVIPASRWDYKKYYDPRPGIPLRSYCNQGGFLDRIECFDNKFFGISEDEVSLIDPKQRILMELAYHGLEHAGMSAQYKTGANAGVFIGSSYNYHEVQMPVKKIVTPYGMLGVSNTLLANRISHLFDFKGPSVFVDTFCSSALVATHLACRSLQQNECDFALVGGIHILVAIHYVGLSQFRALSPSGRCRPFDASADGFVPGEGGGIVVLKRLDRALEDGDKIYGIIRGSAVNHTGKANSITSPNAELQKRAIQSAMNMAGIEYGSVSYIETHGTGTALGDPLEFKGLKNAYKNKTSPDSRCYLGSVKANIGHLEPASGIAGLIKVLLCLEHKQIPGVLHYNKLNKLISLEDTCFAINSETIPWERRNYPLRAGLSSFGLSGTNVHLVLEESPLTLEKAESTEFTVFEPLPHRFAASDGPAQMDMMFAFLYGEQPIPVTPGEALESGEPAASKEDLKDFILHAIARKSKIELSEFDAETDLDEIQLDSVMKIELSYEILENFPKLENLGDAFLTVVTVNEFILLAAPCLKESSVGNNEVEVQSVGEDCELHLRQKVNGENLITRGVETVSLQPYVLKAGLVIDESHSFFFDHPLDHVSGIHLLEAMLQLAATAYRMQNELGEKVALFQDRVQVDFQSVCRKESGNTVLCEQLDYAEGLSGVMLYKTQVTHAGHLCCKASLRCQELKSSETDYPPELAARKYREFIPCNPSLVNKNHEVNVFISAPLNCEAEYTDLIFQLRPVEGHTFFSDYAGSHIAPLYFLEAFRQTQRYLDNTQEPLVDPALIRGGMLISLTLQLDRPVSRGADVSIRFKQVEKTQIGKNFLITTTGILQAGDELVGLCRSQNMILTR